MRFCWLPVLVLAMLVGGCGPRPERIQEQSMNVEQIKQQLMDTDRAFSRMSAKRGMLAAFHHYMAEDGLTLPKMGHPRQRSFYARLLAERESQREDARPLPRLTWEPLAADAAASGELGYTHGRFVLRAMDESGNEEVNYGYYVTIWKKQPDGSWCFVFDAGNESPPPETNTATDTE